MSSWSSFIVRTARSAAERPVRSLNIDRELGLYPSFTYRVGPRCHGYHGHRDPSKVLSEPRHYLWWNVTKFCTLLFGRRRHARLAQTEYAPRCLESQSLPDRPCFDFSPVCAGTYMNILSGRECTCRRFCNYLLVSAKFYYRIKTLTEY
jgi:hypothetical protein